MAKNRAERLEELAGELTRRLGIPFEATAGGTIGFRGRLRITDWAVPLVFDGHAARDHDAMIPTDFVGHLLWPTLRATWVSRKERPWWACSINEHVAEALVEELRGYEEDGEDGGAWVVGQDVLLDGRYRHPDARRRVA